MSEDPSNPALTTRSVLIVGLARDVFTRTAEVVANYGLEAHMSSLAKLEVDTAHYKPLVVLVDSYLYDFDPNAFEKLARKAGAKLGAVGSAKEAEVLLQNILSPQAPPKTEASDAFAAPVSTRDFATAKYDAKTLDQALERMSTKRMEVDTAKYDAKTLREVIKRLDES